MVGEGKGREGRGERGGKGGVNRKVRSPCKTTATASNRHLYAMDPCFCV